MLDSPTFNSSKAALIRKQSSESASSISSRGDANPPSAQVALQRTLIQVTEDNERFAVVDVSGLTSADGIKERMLSKLRAYSESFK